MSKLKLIWKFLFGGREGVLDYVLDVANNFVAEISSAKQNELKGYLKNAQSILDTLTGLKWLCPSKWRKAYLLTISAFADVVTALGDLAISSDEITGIVASFQSAYCAWRTDDSVSTDATDSDDCADGSCSEKAKAK